MNSGISYIAVAPVTTGASPTLTVRLVNTAATGIKTFANPFTFGRSKIHEVNSFLETFSSFTVSSGKKKVNFSKANLFWDGGAWKFEKNQYDYQTGWSATHVCHFFWTKTATASYAKTYSDGICTTNDHFFADGSDDDHMLTVSGQSGWYALSLDEWTYLINTRANASSLRKSMVTVCNRETCLILAPDGYTGKIAKSYTASEWATAETAGLVCLPAAGYRTSSSWGDFNIKGYYWTSSPNTSNVSYACDLRFANNGKIFFSIYPDRKEGESLRLVRE